MPVSQKYINQRISNSQASPFAVSQNAEGIEIRGGALPLKKEELALLTRSYDYDCQLFVLSQPEDLENYKKIMDKLVNKEFLPAGPCVGPEWNDLHKSYVVFLQWVKPFADAPPELERRLRG